MSNACGGCSALLVGEAQIIASQPPPKIVRIEEVTEWECSPQYWIVHSGDMVSEHNSLAGSGSVKVRERTRIYDLTLRGR